MLPNTLAVFDVSPFIYVGHNIKNSYSKDMIGSFPIKGIKYLLKYISSSLQRGYHIVLCFDSKSFRKQYLATYKEHRTPNHEVYAQINYMYEKLSDCGFYCLKQDGYEADDLIYNVVQKYKSQYMQVHIYGVDYDLTHNIDKNVSLKSISSQCVDIDYNSFSHLVVKDKFIRFNSITAYKLFHGDASDNVKPFNASGFSPQDFYENFLKLYDTKFSKYGEMIMTNKKLAQYYANIIKGNITEAEYKELLKRVEVFYPREIDLNAIHEPSSLLTVNRDMFIQLLNVLDDTTSLKYFNNLRVKTPKILTDELFNRGRELVKGEYAVDNNITLDPSRLNSQSMFLKEF